MNWTWLRPFLLAFLLAQPAFAQDAPAPASLPVVSTDAAQADAGPPPRPYTTTVTPTGDDGLDTALRNASRLIALQERAPTDLPGLIARATGEAERLRSALDSEGYFAGTARVEIAGADPLAPDLARRLPAEGPIPVTITAQPGQRYLIRNLTAVGPSATGDEQAALARAADHLEELQGQPARAADIVEAQARILSRLQRAGHPLAEVSARDVVVNHDAHAMDVTLTVAPGPFARYAAPEVAGTDRVRPDFLRRYAATRLEGRPYDPDRTARARADIVALGVFDGVRMEPGRALDERGRLPISITVSERKRRAVGVTAAYETRFGATITTYFEHRNLFGAAERLRIEADLTRIGASEASRTGYRLGGSFRDPFAFNRDIAFVGSLFILRERLETYDRDAVVGSFLFERRLTDRLVLATGPAFEIGRSGPARGKLDPAQVLGWQFQARWDSTDNLLDPRRGIRAQATVTPSYSLEEGNLFLSTRAQASTYFDVSGNGRSILAVRGSVGQLFGTEALDVPISQRFFAGGGGSVRGYDFQSIGPRQPGSRRSTGGSSLLDGSLEWRQRFGANWGAVAFVDAGRVGGGGGSGQPSDRAAWRVGAGLGARYYTAIGPVRVDFALPLVKQPSSQGYGLYIGIGHAF